MRAGVGGVGGDGALKVENGGGETGGSAFVPVKPAAEVVAVGLRAQRLAADEGLALFGVEAPDKPGCDVTAEFLLDGLQLAGLAFVARAPELGGIGRGEQLGGDDEPPAAFGEAAHQDRIRA